MVNWHACADISHAALQILQSITVVSKFVGPAGQSDISYECPTKNVGVPDQMSDRNYKQEAQRATYRAPEYNVPPFWGIGQGGHFCLLIIPKNTNSEEDVEILLPVKFRWITFSSFRGKVENVSANQRPGRPSCFSHQPEKHKLGRGRWDLASCQVSLNSVQRFQRRSRKCLSQSEARAAIFFFDRPEKHTLGRGRWDLASY